MKKILLIIIMLYFINLVQATVPYASTFVENKTIIIEEGETFVYCIYPQNTKNETIMTKLIISEGEELIINGSPETIISIPPNTKSDDIKKCFTLKYPQMVFRYSFEPVNYSIGKKGMVGTETIVGTAFNVSLKQKIVYKENQTICEDNFKKNGILLSIIFCIIFFIVVNYYQIYKTNKKWSNEFKKLK